MRGKGSGHIEIGQREETLEPLHLLINADRQVDLIYAQKLATDLLDTVKAEIEAARAVPVPTVFVVLRQLDFIDGCDAYGLWISLCHAIRSTLSSSL